MAPGQEALLSNLRTCDHLPCTVIDRSQLEALERKTHLQTAAQVLQDMREKCVFGHC